MNLHRRRIAAIMRKEIRELRRNRSILFAMALLPLIFIIQPLVAVLGLRASAAGALSHEHVLLYLLGIPTLVPPVLAATAIAGERQQGTLEPVLTTPIRSEELLLGKALAAFVPAVVIAYAVFAVFLLLTAVFGEPQIVAALVQWPDFVAQIVFTPLLAGWSIWVGIAVSTRARDVRVAQQLGILASLPVVLITVLIALSVITPTLGLAIAAGLAVLVLDVVGWRFVARLFDRETLVTGAR
jgi:ABC-2 type transport system permease protein